MAAPAFLFAFACMLSSAVRSGEADQSPAKSATATRPSPSPPAVDAAPASSAVPAPGELNAYVLEVTRRYATDGTHRYYWPRGQANGWRGCTKDLEYAGQTLCEGDPEKRAYCCGLTFEVFLDAWRLWCERTKRPWKIKDMSLAQVRQLQSQWFGSASDMTCLRTALVDNDLGRQITDLEQARAGDFVQLWRASGSGHSVVFLDWVREGGEIVGIEYWSTQEKTNGIAVATESFKHGGGGRVKRDEFYLCRVGVPVDPKNKK